MQLGFSEEGVTLFIGDAPAFFPWMRFTQLWQFWDCWMLVMHDLTFMPLPTELMEEEEKLFIAMRMEQTGGKVKEDPGIGLGLVWKQQA